MNDIKKNKLLNYKKKCRCKYLIASCFFCLIIRILIFLLLNVLEGSNYEYINKLINIDETMNEAKNELNNVTKFKYNKNEKLKELEQYFQTNKRNNQLKQFLFKNDSMHYSFNSDIYNFKYIYESYVLSKLYKDIYYSLTVRINPLFLKFIHFIIFKKLRFNNSTLSNITNNYEFRYYIFITIIDILIAIFLFLIIEKLMTWDTYFNYVNQNKKERWKLINSILLINIYLNNPLTILSNSFLSLDNFKLLIVTTSFYLSLLRINEFSKKFLSILNLFMIIFFNAILLYVSSFHFILIIIGINNFIICIHEKINKHEINENVKFYNLFRILLKNIFLLLSTLTTYFMLIYVSSYFNENSMFFLNNTLINEYKLLFLLPNLGNFWYIFSLMFRDYYYSFLFLFHFHVFLYPLPLFFRLVKTPLIYLTTMITIALVFQPNITINDIVYSLLILAIDYEKTLYTIPFIKLLIILLGNLSLFSVTINLWLRKNTGNANYVYFNQIVIFNIITYIISNSLKFYIRVQTPTAQLEEGKCIFVSKKKKRLNILKMLKNKFS
ncbi:GPI transamidase subunit PIG-U, putative [Plasmodium gallinaceum]|uniref:GPI transamidase subunit PIG-U, putative n=1 Tax=Plasmodium gallinaceum TaxID=5849 RepID=A0A1J1GUP8_PLAGA|nr:GPI transamidase subunit PIG-U, putative [Plasmodium gallinaceum]CRG95032.1 GPI transamidase subunit PIG-U, putative [Plasmodium gallinaceum]